MNQAEEIIADAQGKVDEASFLLARMREAITHPHLDEAERQFGLYFSSFLSDARSVLQIISRHEGIRRKSATDDWSWLERAKEGWANDDRKLLQLLKKLRDDSIHQGRGKVESRIEFVAEQELLFRPRDALIGYVSISQPLGLDVPPQTFAVKRFSLKVGDQTVPALECAERYLSLVKLALDHYKAAMSPPSAG